MLVVGLEVGAARNRPFYRVPPAKSKRGLPGPQSRGGTRNGFRSGIPAGIRRKSKVVGRFRVPAVVELVVAVRVVSAGHAAAGFATA